jgi:divalent metal cation (Fe/Co/Zn/Cd) transporter
MNSNILLQQTDRAAIIRRGQYLEYFTIGYNSLEGLIAVGAGFMAGSIALVGFGVDSLIEVTSGSILLWRLHADVNEARRERIEAISVRLVGACFMLLALYVTYDSVKSLVKREAPAESIVGIILAAVSVVVMPLLVRAKRKVARSINSGALMADSKQTELCTYLSAILLAGLLLNALLGWWWADPVAALIMVPIIVKEGVEGLRGETCCDDGCGPTGG